MICCPLTTQIKNYRFEVLIGGAPPSAVLADQLWQCRTRFVLSVVGAHGIDGVVPGELLLKEARTDGRLRRTTVVIASAMGIPGGKMLRMTSVVAAGKGGSEAAPDRYSIQN